MNKIKISALGIIVLLGLFNVPAPTRTSAATSCDSRTITGYVITNGNDTNARFNYDTSYSSVSTGGGIKTATQFVARNDDHNIDQLIVGLSPNTQYFYALQVKKSGTVNWITLNVENFTTPTCTQAPVNPTVNITASPMSVNYGGSSTLEWSSTNATFCSASGGTNNWEGDIDRNGWQGTGVLTSTTTFSITCYGATGTTPATDQVTVTVGQAQLPIVTISANPMSVSYGGTSTITWDSTYATSCRGTGGSGTWEGSRAPDGSFTAGNLTSTTTYNITCYNSAGNSASDSVTVTVGNQPSNPTVNLTANPTSIQSGQSSTLIWSSQNAVSCSAPWTGSNSPSGSQTVSPGSTTTYNITCMSSTGQQASDSATVTVTQVQNASGNLTISPSSCIIASGQSTCTTSATWTTTNATSPAVIDRNTGNTLSTSANNSTPMTVWVAFPSTTFDLRNGSSILDTEVATASCASGTTWNNSICAVTNVQTPTVNLTANPTSIQSGQSSTLIWSSQNAVSCSAPWTGSNSPSGSQTVSPGSTTTYNITCMSSTGQQASAQATVTVGTVGGQAPTVDLRADDTSIDEGDETELTWTSTNADYCSRTGGRNGWDDDRVSTSGNFDTGDLTRDTTYTIRCFNDFGSDSDSVTVRVDDDDDDRECTDPNALNYRGSYPCSYPPYIPPTPPQIRPTVILYADQASISYNSATFVRWNTVNATSCQASGGSTGWSVPTAAKSIGPGSFYTGSLSSSRTYTLTCYNSAGSDTDSVTVSVRRPATGGPTPPPASSLVLVTSSIDRNQPIVPTLDNTRPRPGDEITYTVNYQNIGTGAIRNLVLRLDLPYEVVYRYSTPSNPTIAGNTLIFNLGTLAANGSGTVTVRVLVRQDAPPGALLNFPAVLSYIDPAGFPQTVTANVSAQVWNMETIQDNTNLLGAAAFFSGGFWPTTLFGWLLLIILVLLLVLLARYLMDGGQPFERRTTTTTIQH